MRRTERLAELRQDLTDTARTLRKQPGFVLTVVGTLGLSAERTASRETKRHRVASVAVAVAG